jgi:hypothetical protein
VLSLLPFNAHLIQFSSVRFFDLTFVGNEYAPSFVLTQTGRTDTTFSGAQDNQVFIRSVHELIIEV